jgi:hypothetical protein
MVKGLDVFRGDFFLKVVDAQITFVTNAVNSASLSPQSPIQTAAGRADWLFFPRRLS